jgi:hypothetical protein
VLAISKDYTDQDFDAIRLRLISLIKSLPNFADWTDFAVADLGNILLESFAFVGDALGFNMDHKAREAKWGTAQQLRSILRLAKQIAYVPKGASAASSVVTVTAADLAANVALPAHTIIKTRKAPTVDFQTLESLLLTPGVPSGTVNVENSLTITETSEASSDPWQTVVLGQVPYLQDSLQITTSQGTWSQKLSFLASKGSDLHFTVGVDANDRATVTFGDGTTGAKPSGTITRIYKTGGGLEGMVDVDSITEIQGTFYDVLGNRVDLSATNAAKPVGGDPKETVATVKVRAPLVLRAGDRTVSREDFELRARAAAGVGRALFLTRQEDAAVDPNTGLLWTVPTGLGFLTPTIRNAIAAEFVKYPYTASFVVNIMDPWYLDVSVFARVYLSSTAKKLVVKQTILTNLAAFFALTARDVQGNTIDNPTSAFGYYNQDSDGTPTGVLNYSDLFDIVKDTVGVRKVGGNTEDFLLSSAVTNLAGSTALETNVHKDLTLNKRYYPRLGTVTLVDGDTGLTL